MSPITLSRIRWLSKFMEVKWFGFVKCSKITRNGYYRCFVGVWRLECKIERRFV